MINRSMKKTLFGLFCLLLLSSFGGEVKQEHLSPEYLYKIISFEEFQEGMIQDQGLTSSMDTNFIHLATEEQLPHIVGKYWKNQDHLILKLVSKKLVGRLILETNPGGTTQYYHLYDGKIPLDAIVDISIIHH